MCKGFPSLLSRRSLLVHTWRDHISKHRGAGVYLLKACKVEDIQSVCLVGNCNMSSKVMMGKGSTDILIVGKTGHGRSATANTIVGYKAFQSKCSHMSVTKTAQFEYGEFEGRILKVVDGPGIGYNLLNAEEGIKLVIDAMTFAVAANPAGYHAIVIVVSYTDRMTDEEIYAIRLLKDIFGVDFIKNHGILLMTHGDSFATSGEETGESFEEWIRLQEGKIQDLIGECSGRVILFNNRETDENRKKKQIRELLGIIDRLAAHGQRYTSDIFNKGKEARDKLLKESTKIQLKEESLMECALITQELARMNNDNPAKSLHILQNLLPRTSQLKESIEQQDQGTKQLSVAIHLAEQLKESVIERTKDANEVLKMKEQMKQMEAELEMEQMRLEAEEKKRKEEKRKYQKEKERQTSKEEEIKMKLEQIIEENKKAMMEKEAVKQKQLVKIQNSYESFQFTAFGLLGGKYSSGASSIVIE